MSASVFTLFSNASGTNTSPTIGYRSRRSKRSMSAIDLLYTEVEAVDAAVGEVEDVVGACDGDAMRRVPMATSIRGGACERSGF